MGRRFVSPRAGEDLTAIAERELPGEADGAQRLLSWNLHLAARAGAGRGGLLPSDVVFTEPPPAA